MYSGGSLLKMSVFLASLIWGYHSVLIILLHHNTLMPAGVDKICRDCWLLSETFLLCCVLNFILYAYYVSPASSTFMLHFAALNLEQPPLSVCDTLETILCYTHVVESTSTTQKT